MSREFIFSDKRVQDALLDFIPVALNTYGLQWETPATIPEARTFFFKVVDQADLYEGVPEPYRSGEPRFPYHPTKSPQGTTQGFYVCNATGELEFATWALFANWGPDRLLKGLRKLDLPRDKKAPAKSVKEPVKAPKVKSLAPDDAAVVNVYCKLAMTDPKQPMPEGIQQQGRDVMWITRNEQAALSLGRFPGTLRTRIILFHLIDTSPGIPQCWGAEDVKSARISLELRKSPEGNVWVIKGTYSLEKPDKSAGLKGTLAGQIRIRDRKLDRFRLVAKGHAWQPPNEDNWPPEGGYRMSIGFVVSKDPADRQILPMLPMFGKETSDAYLEYDLSEE